MGAAAVRAAESVDYSNAGTCEFMLDSDGSYYFLEMNARLQVEHPVTELVYGIDLVQWQLRIAAGERLTLAQTAVQPRGWAIEARIYAEDPANDMLPSTGTIANWTPPEGPGIRVDAGVATGSDRVALLRPDARQAHRVRQRSGRRHRTLARRAGRSLRSTAFAPTCRCCLWIARDERFSRGETTTSFLNAPRRNDLRRKSRRPRRRCLLCVAALLADGCAPWRIGEVGVPLRLQHDLGVVTLTADAGEATPACGASPATSPASCTRNAARSTPCMPPSSTDARSPERFRTPATASPCILTAARGRSRFAAPPSADGADAAHAGATAAQRDGANARQNRQGRRARRRRG